MKKSTSARLGPPPNAAFTTLCTPFFGIFFALTFVVISSSCIVRAEQAWGGFNRMDGGRGRQSDCYSQMSVLSTLSGAGIQYKQLPRNSPLLRSSKLSSSVLTLHGLRGGGGSARVASATSAVSSPSTSSASISSVSATNPKLHNFLHRLPPALAMLLTTYVLIKHLGENGIIALVLILQIGMYHEICSIVETFHSKVLHERAPDLEQVWEKWWWFATVVCGTSLRALVKKFAHVTDESTVDLITYGMGAVGLVGAVIGMATHVSASAEAFRSYLGKVAACHFALLFLVGQSSFWLMTVHDFGVEWVLFPALLVIVNDTMAYAFGMTMGKHKLLPRLSPKKTVEGFLGAGASTLAVSIPLLKFVLKTFGDTAILEGEGWKRHALVLAAFASLVSPFGGFLASAVKRAHDAKDFGTLIPGHGGIVDRFDCQVVTAPFVYLYLRRFLGE